MIIGVGVTSLATFSAENALSAASVAITGAAARIGLANGAKRELAKITRRIIVEKAETIPQAGWKRWILAVFFTLSGVSVKLRGARTLGKAARTRFV